MAYEMEGPEHSEGGLLWFDGDPPRDGRTYEMRRRVALADLDPWTVWQETGWWDGCLFARRSQMHGGTDALIGGTQWRHKTPSVEAGSE